MADAVQWSIDEFWSQLQNLQDQITQADDALNSDKATLQSIYSTMRQNMDPTRDAFVAPLIHQNTVLRMNYLAPIKSKFNSIVGQMSSALTQAGYTTPQLSGLGVAPLIVGAAIVAAVVLALAAVAIVWRMTQDQVTRTNAIASMYQDPNTTAAQKIALGQQMTADIVAQNKATPPPLGFDFGAIMPILAVVAVIVLGPEIMRAINGRRRATA
jgi:hypothetical protein